MRQPILGEQKQALLNPGKQVVVNMQENSALLNPPIAANTSAADSVLIRSGSVAFNSLLLALHIAANGKMLTMLDANNSGAGALIASFQTVILGGAGGCLLGTGIEIGKIIGESRGAERIAKLAEAGEITKSAWLMSFLFGGIATVAMILTKAIFPLLFDSHSANTAANFFLGYAAAGIPSVLMVTSPQIAFQADDWLMPMLLAAAFYVPAGFLSYYFAFNCNMGSFGIGLGGSIASIVSIIGMQLCFLRERYSHCNLYKRPLLDVKNNIKKLWSTGWPLSLQRLTEWVNLTLLTTIIGIDGPKSLAATHATIQYIVVVALSIQGLAHATAMLIAKYRKQMSTAWHENRQDEFQDWHRKNTQILTKNNLLGLAVGAVTAGLFYGYRSALSGFFLRTDEGESTRDLSTNLLWIAMLGAIPDTVRIICLGALRGWKSVLGPTGTSFAITTIAGIAGGFILNTGIHDHAKSQFISRGIMMIIAGLVVAKQCYDQLAKDLKQPELAFSTTAAPTQSIKNYLSSCASSVCSFFRAPVTRCCPSNSDGFARLPAPVALAQ